MQRVDRDLVEDVERDRPVEERDGFVELLLGLAGPADDDAAGDSNLALAGVAQNLEGLGDRFDRAGLLHDRAQAAACSLEPEEESVESRREGELDAAVGDSPAEDDVAVALRRGGPLRCAP